MNKPPILSDEKVVEWFKANHGEELTHYRQGTELDTSLIVEGYGTTAQRDADVEWFREDSKQLALECHKCANRRVEQARREVAREIFQDLEEVLLITHDNYRMLEDKFYSEIKAKYSGK